MSRRRKPDERRLNLGQKPCITQQQDVIDFFAFIADFDAIIVVGFEFEKQFPKIIIVSFHRLTPPRSVGTSSAAKP